MKKLIPLTLIAILPLAGCASSKPQPMAIAMLVPTPSNTARGTVHLMENRDGNVEVQLDLTGVPAGLHGFHIHEKGDCSDNGMAAGGHFNPMNTPHAGPETMPHHAGDFGNVTADANGVVHTTVTMRGLTLTGANSAVGRAVILHANADDLTTQPSGNSGARIACGVVQAMEGDMAAHNH